MSIKQVSINDPESQSASIVTSNIKALQSLFPEAFADGKIDFDVLRQIIGDEVDDGDERYGLNWPGKKRTRRLALTPSTGTLLPAFSDSVNWDGTKNVVIEGDNLEVLKLLQKSYFGKIKMIYIDPPYNTGNAMLYPNDFADSTRAYLEFTEQKDGGVSLVSNSKSDGRFHSKWLSMFYPLLLISKSLLRQDGVFVITIDENEIASVLILLEEIFGKETYDIVPVSVVHNPRGVQGTNFSATHEYAVFVARKGEKLIADRPISDEEVDWSPLRNWGGESLRTDARNCFFPILVKNGEIVGFGDVSADEFHPSSQTELSGDISYVYPIDRTGVERKWRYARQTVESILPFLKAKKIEGGYDILLGKKSALYKTIWSEQRHDASVYGTQLVNQLLEAPVFSFPKSLFSVMDSVAASTANREGIILDFFAGSGTTGHAVMAQNALDDGDRRFVLVQLPEPLDPENKEQRVAAQFCDSLGKPRTIASVTEERLRRAAAKIKSEHPDTQADLGFRVYKLATSNLRPWEPSDDLAADLLAGADNIVPDRTEEDLLTELLLKQGIDLTEPMVTEAIAGVPVHAMGGGVLVVCLAPVTVANAEALADGIADWTLRLNPVAATTMFFRDSGFESDVAKANVAAILEQRLEDNLLKVRSL
jgi:adenine-specific DNA-methyltransferase